MLTQQVLNAAFLPAACLFIGGIVALIRTPSAKLTSGTQHFAAGVVFAAVAIELLPSISHSKQPVAITLGFLIGLTLMILVKHFTGHGEDHGHDAHPAADAGLPLGMIFAVGIDVFIDGALIGIAYKAGSNDGLLVTIALAIEILFLGLSLAATMASRAIPALRNFAVITLLTPIVILGALASVFTISALPTQWLSGILAFGVAALLYLVTEELLVEAHETEETPLITAAFFIGFLCIFLLDTQF